MARLGRLACFRLGGLLVDLACEIDEAKKAVWRGDASGAFIGFEGAWLRARDVARDWPEKAKTAMKLHDEAKRLAEALKGRRDPLSYQEKRELEMAAILMAEEASGLIGDGKDECREA